MNVSFVQHCSKWKFTILLASLLGLLIIRPLFRDEVPAEVIRDVLFTVVFLATLFALTRRGKHRLILTVSGTVAVLGSWLHYVTPDRIGVHVGVAAHLFGAVFLASAALAIMRSVILREEISLDSIFGAFCGYLLVGLVWTSLFVVVEEVRPGSFAAQPDWQSHLADRSNRWVVLSYYSMTTLTTLGYGDIVPASNQARLLSWLEAMTGQFYIAAFVAGLVGLSVSQTFHKKTTRHLESQTGKDAHR
jgi:hypothetical protein